jgi:hypothetical protein
MAGQRAFDGPNDEGQDWEEQKLGQACPAMGHQPPGLLEQAWGWGRRRAFEHRETL